MLKYKKKRYIAIIGGSFDPPHDGHHLIAKWIMQHHHIHQLWFMVTKNNPLKHQHSSNYQERYEQCKKKWGGYKIQPKNYETWIQSSYTIDMLRQLRKKFQHYQFLFVIGDDNFATLSQWKDYDLLPKYCTLAVVARHHNKRHRYKFTQPKILRHWTLYSLNQTSKWHKIQKQGYFYHQNPLCSLSSTRIRMKPDHAL